MCVSMPKSRFTVQVLLYYMCTLCLRKILELVYDCSDYVQEQLNETSEGLGTVMILLAENIQTLSMFLDKQN